MYYYPLLSSPLVSSFNRTLSFVEVVAYQYLMTPKYMTIMVQSYWRKSSRIRSVSYMPGRCPTAFDRIPGKPS